MGGKADTGSLSSIPTPFQLVVLSYRIWKAKSSFPEILKAKALKVTQAALNAPALMRPQMQKGKKWER